jgi:hypothetical protein
LNWVEGVAERPMLPVCHAMDACAVFEIETRVIRWTARVQAAAVCPSRRLEVFKVTIQSPYELIRGDSLRALPLTCGVASLCGTSWIAVCIIWQPGAASCRCYGTPGVGYSQSIPYLHAFARPVWTISSDLTVRATQTQKNHSISASPFYTYMSMYLWFSS